MWNIKVENKFGETVVEKNSVNNSQRIQWNRVSGILCKGGLFNI